MGLCCPVDKGSKLVAVTVSKDTLDYCSSCHGFWFSGDELIDIEELPGSELMSEFQDELDNGEIVETREGEGSPECLVCQSPMNRYQFNLPKGIWVYACSGGDGVWLEKTDVLKIHNHLLKDMKSLPKEKQKKFAAELQEMQDNEERKAEEAALAEFASKTSKIPLSHLMDGVCRFMVHMVFKLAV